MVVNFLATADLDQDYEQFNFAEQSVPDIFAMKTKK